MFRENLTDKDVVKIMLELAYYLSKQEGDANEINASINMDGETLYMRF